MTARFTIPAFSGYGVELEYMIVDRRTLDVRPIADDVLRELAGHDASDVTRGALGWSNELVRHVMELKNVAPTADLRALPARFDDEIQDVNRRLARVGAELMPTAMHPWMNPLEETVLWEDAGGIYRTYDRIYDCRGHGWSNLQSVHINLPFADDAQFARLHAAVRLVLPLVPALAASSPIAEGRFTGFLDFRLENYRSISARTPSVAGSIIPETVDTRAEYEARILAPMYEEVAQYDPSGVLRHEWLNSRGAIARFDRNAIEIRLADIQECPQADIAIAETVIALVKWLYDERPSSCIDQRALGTTSLYRALLATIRDAEHALVDDVPYLRVLGLGGTRCRACEIWQCLLEQITTDGATDTEREVRDVILQQGTLARRILRAVGNAERRRLHDVYRKLCACLSEGRMFV
jgi:gamma-glutamyl:cysteine ligase YbdK (ATP-grasp superfamily)